MSTLIVTHAQLSVYPWCMICLSSVEKERKTAALSVGRTATNGVQLWAIVSYVKAALGVSEVTLL